MIKDIFNIKFKKEEFENLYLDILKGINVCKYSSEAKLRQLTEEKLNNFLIKFGIDLTNFREYESGSIGLIKVNGRTDALYSNIVIEFKKYALLSSKYELNSALKQIKEQYLDKIPQERKKNFVGIIFDGKTIIFVKYNYVECVWKESIKDFSENTLFDWILLLVGVNKKQVHPDFLNRDFSIESPTIKNFISVLYKRLCYTLDNGHARVKMLFNEWDKTFRYIYGGILDETRLKYEFEEIIKSILHDEENIKVDRFLFVLYSYYAFIVKLFASEIACINLKMYPETPIKVLLNSKEIKDDLKYIEDGLFFKDYLKIDNYIEGGFFSWYLDAYDTQIETGLKKVLQLINEYDPQSFINDEHISRDLLKNLFQDIVPQRIRHDLGEYYTPDWLIQLTVDEAGYHGKPDEKVLDPGCGSGGFIIEFINLLKKYNFQHAQLNNKEMLNIILNNVIGFDVNPVAVLTARTNYLIAISSLLEYADKPITIPIYLADSIITPTIGGRGTLVNDSYKLKTVVGTFSLPKILVEKNQMGSLLALIEETVPQYYPVTDFKKLLNKQISDIKESDIKEIEAFYNELVELHKSNKNKIWVKIIQNSFAPLLHSNFDYVIGNPPWIKWDFLSEDYKEKLRLLYQDVYNLFSHKGMKASMGYAHDDLSILFTYIAMDKYLKDKGTLGFVLKQTIYKSIAGKEFRKFQITKKNDAIPIKILKVHDLLQLTPFGSGAETSIAILKKNEKTEYPVKYTIWRKKAKERITELSTIEYVKKVTEMTDFKAYPDPFSGDITDVWIIVPEGSKLPKISKTGNNYLSRHGVVNDLNGVFMLKINSKKESGLLSVNNLADFGKKKVKEIRAEIEPDLIYPLIKPDNTKKWKIDKYHYILLPHKKDGENNESFLRVNYPKSYAYLNRFKDELLSRKSKWFKGEGKPFYSLFGIGKYTFMPFKIVWCCMSYKPYFSVVSKITDEYIGTKTLIPDNTIGNISFDSEKEAHFVCAILNSEKAKFLFSIRSSKSKWGISIEMVKKIPIPKFNPKNKEHLKLSDISMKAHRYANKNELDNINKIEEEINQIAEKII